MPRVPRNGEMLIYDAIEIFDDGPQVCIRFHKAGQGENSGHFVWVDPDDIGRVAQTLIKHGIAAAQNREDEMRSKRDLRRRFTRKERTLRQQMFGE